MNALAPTPMDETIIKRFLEFCHQNKYPPRTNIVVPGDYADSLFYVIEGSLDISMVGEDERDSILPQSLSLVKWDSS